jgi:hypothetical protein
MSEREREKMRGEERESDRDEDVIERQRVTETLKKTTEKEKKK